MKSMQDRRDEEWRQLKINTNYYVSNLGRVKSFQRGKEKIMAESKNPKIYTSVRINGKSIRSHRLIAEAFGIIKENEWVNHIDGRRNNNKVSNLEKSNPSHNLKHAFKTALHIHIHGETHHQSKLNDKKAIDVIKMYSKGIALKKIANKFNISMSLASGVARGKFWKHLDEYRTKYKIKRRFKLAEIRKLTGGEG